MLTPFSTLASFRYFFFFLIRLKPVERPAKGVNTELFDISEGDFPIAKVPFTRFEITRLFHCFAVTAKTHENRKIMKVAAMFVFVLSTFHFGFLTLKFFARSLARYLQWSFTRLFLLQHFTPTAIFLCIAATESALLR